MTWQKETSNNTAWQKPSISSTWAKESSGNASWDINKLLSFLLMEDGFFLLQEDSKKILLELSQNTNWNLETAGAGAWTKI